MDNGSGGMYGEGWIMGVGGCMVRGEGWMVGSVISDR